MTTIGPDSELQENLCPLKSVGAEDDFAHCWLVSVNKKKNKKKNSKLNPNSYQ